MRPPWKQQQEKRENENVREALKEDNYDVHTEWGNVNISLGTQQ